MADIKSRAVTNKALFLGDNEYETGVLTIPATGTVPAGALLKRENGKFAPVVNTSPVEINVGDTDTVNVPVPGVPADIPVAVNPIEISNPGNAAADIPFRALVAGKVRADMLSVNGQPITDAQSDMLRSYGILPRKVTDISRLDN
jgi:hypothetical protein